MTLAREKRVRKRRDYLRVQRHGFRSFGRFIVAVAQRNKDKGDGKIGITVPKKVGPAHVRNKVKRRIRHVMRMNQRLFFEKTLVIVVRESVGTATFSELQADLVDTCGRLKSNGMTRPRHRHTVKTFVAPGASHEYSVRLV